MSSTQKEARPTPDQLWEEREWLRRRARNSGSFVCDANRDWGISSNAMVEHALGGKFPDQASYPLDKDDYKACLRCSRNAPKHLQQQMHKVLRAYEQHLFKEKS